MSKYIFELFSDGVRDLLKSEEVQKCVEEHAQTVKDRLSGNYEMDTQIGKYRAITRIKTADDRTYYKNLSNNEMLKALHK